MCLYKCKNIKKETLFLQEIPDFQCENRVYSFLTYLYKLNGEGISSFIKNNIDINKHYLVKELGALYKLKNIDIDSKAKKEIKIHDKTKYI